MELREFESLVNRELNRERIFKIPLNSSQLIRVGRGGEKEDADLLVRVLCIWNLGWVDGAAEAAPLQNVDAGGDRVSHPRRKNKNAPRVGHPAVKVVPFQSSDDRADGCAVRIVVRVMVRAGTPALQPAGRPALQFDLCATV